MKHRSATVALVAALVAAPMALTATAAAAPSAATPAAVASATAADPLDTGREMAEQVLERSEDRLARSQPSRAGAVSAQPTESALAFTTAAFTTGRLAGANRFDTSALISRDSHPNPNSADPDFGGVVFIANGMNFPDALAAGPAATSLSAPILLVPPTGGLPPSVRAEIIRLDPDSAVILGGTDNVGVQVVTELQSIMDPSGVFRVAGSNRFETSALLSLFVVNYEETTPGIFVPVPVDTAVISTGSTFADALAGGAAGGWEYAPLLLTATGALPPSVDEALRGQPITTVRILGSTASVSAAVESRVRAILPGATVIRYPGVNRFDTARRLNADVFDVPSFEITMANGVRFPDALAGAPRVNKTGGPTVLVLPACAPAETVTTLNNFFPGTVTALGGTDAVSAAALAGTPC